MRTRGLQGCLMMIERLWFPAPERQIVTAKTAGGITYVPPFAGNITSEHPECDSCTWVYRLLDNQWWLKFRNNWCTVRHETEVMT